jgi:spore maturation protein CgeB
MSIGQPVVSWRIPGHPRTTRLFNDGEQIVLFDHDDPDRLADALQVLRDDPVRTRRIAAAGLANARRHHTSEHRVAQILEWIASGITPAYWDDAGQPSTQTSPQEAMTA